MAAYKSCPSCGAEAPASASRCKDCFYDFSAASKRNFGPLILLGSLSGMGFIAAAVFFYISGRPLEVKSVVDQETQSIRFVTTYRSGPVTEQVKFADVGKIESVHTSDGKFDLYAVTLDGDRKLIAHSDETPLDHEGDQYSKLMNKPLEQVDQTGIKTEKKPD